jgi:hypothetical protein
MPNLSPRGLWGTPAGSSVPLAASQVWATLPGSTTPQEAVEVWCGAADGTPVLVFATAPGTPTGVAAAYSSTDGTVTVSWTTPAAADSFVVKRADGSTVGTVGASNSQIVDTAPRALTGTYTVTALLAGMTGTPAASNSLALGSAPQDVTATLDGSTVVVGWLHPTYGQPATSYRVERNGSTVATLSRTLTTWTDTNPPVGTVTTYAIVPVFGSTTGTSDSDTESVPAAVPTSVSLVASGSNNLRLSWAHPSGSRTGYEVERYVSSWAAHATLGSSSTSSDWSTTVAGSMRVRTLSAGGASAWVQVGPVTPNDTTPPGAATLTSWKPESSFGRLVVRATMPSDSDLASYRVKIRKDSGTEYVALDWTATTPGASIAVNPVTGSAWHSYRVKVETRDASGNVTASSTLTYDVVASPIEIPNEWPYQSTWKRPLGDEENGYWRDDWQRSSQEMATGGLVYSGENIGCWFYGTEIASQLAGKTLTSITVEYARQNEYGLWSAVQPLFWLHDLEDPYADVEPSLYDGGVSQSARLGSGVNRYGTTAAVWSLPAAWLPILQAGSWKGIAMYRSGIGSDIGDGSDAYYMHLANGGYNWEGNPTVQHGLLKAYHLG